MIMLDQIKAYHQDHVAAIECRNTAILVAVAAGYSAVAIAGAMGRERLTPSGVTAIVRRGGGYSRRGRPPKGVSIWSRGDIAVARRRDRPPKESTP